MLMLEMSSMELQYLNGVDNPLSLGQIFLDSPDITKGKEYSFFE